MCTPLINNIQRVYTHNIYIIIRDFIFLALWEWNLPLTGKSVVPLLYEFPDTLCMKVEACLYSHLILLENLQHQLFEHHGLADSIICFVSGDPEFRFWFRDQPQWKFVFFSDSWSNNFEHKCHTTAPLWHVSIFQWHYSFQFISGSLQERHISYVTGK